MTSEWASAQALRGVSEGDMTRYALPRREPLLVELEAFCDLAAAAIADAPVVTLEEGLETVALRRGGAGRAPAAARRCVLGSHERRRRRPRQGRPAARGAARARGPRGRRLRHRPARRRPRQRAAARRSPARRGWRRRSREVVARRAPARQHRHDGRGRRGPDLVVARAAAARRRGRRSRTGAPSTPSSPRSARGLRAGHDGRDRDDACRSARRARRIAPALEAASGLRAEEDFWIVFSPERVFSGRVLRDLATYPKLVGGLSAARRGARRRPLRRVPRRRRLARWAAPRRPSSTKLAETTYRDVNIALRQRARPARRRAGPRRRPRHRRAPNSQPFSHVHRPGVAVGGHCIPVYPRFYLAGDPDARLPAAAREVNDGDARLRRRAARRRAGRHRRRRAC